MVGCGVGAKLGVLIKSGAVLEALAKSRCIVFDKTGTLTRGELVVEAVVPLAGSSAHDVLFFASCAERHSDHPVAKAVVRHAQSSSVPYGEASSVQESGGLGISCEVRREHTNNAKVCVGSPRMFQEDLNEVARAMLDQLESKGCTAIVVQVDGELIGVLGLRDEAKDDAASSVAALCGMGFEVFMLSGDNFSAAHVVAADVGIESSHVVANVLPGEKAEAVRGLQARFGPVVFVGDGINDAPALCVADVGVAIGGGTQVAMEAADVVLMHSQLVDVVAAVDLARAVLGRIHVNFGFALAYNCLGLVVACGAFYPWTHVVLPAWVAAGAMALSSVSVVSASLALKWYRPPTLEALFGHKRGGKVGVDAVLLTKGGVEQRTQVDVGCLMLTGGECSCTPEECTCVWCAVHSKV
jgi:heavy metal translocating P-type ATPase